MRDPQWTGVRCQGSPEPSDEPPQSDPMSSPTTTMSEDDGHMKSQRLPPELANAPWITKEGWLDPAKFPIETPVGQCLNPRADAFGHGCRFLGSMAAHGRKDAGIFLLGLLRYHEDDLAIAATVVESLGRFQDDRCIKVLFAELRRVASSNATRRYLNTVVRTLLQMRSDKVPQGFGELARDSSFSYRMREKFAAASEEHGYLWRG